MVNAPQTPVGCFQLLSHSGHHHDTGKIILPRPAVLLYQPQVYQLLAIPRSSLEDDPIPTASKQPVKSLRRWYDPSLKDKDQVQQLQKEMSDRLRGIDSTQLPGRLKAWCLQFEILPRMLWPLTILEVPISTVETLERKITGYIKK